MRQYGQCSPRLMRWASGIRSRRWGATPRRARAADAQFEAIGDVLARSCWLLCDELLRLRGKVCECQRSTARSSETVAAPSGTLPAPCRQVLFLRFCRALARAQREIGAVGAPVMRKTAPQASRTIVERQLASSDVQRDRRFCDVSDRMNA
jgi:hypothetical protein